MRAKYFRKYANRFRIFFQLLSLWLNILSNGRMSAAAATSMRRGLPLYIVQILFLCLTFFGDIFFRTVGNVDEWEWKDKAQRIEMAGNFRVAIDAIELRMLVQNDRIKWYFNRITATWP